MALFWCQLQGGVPGEAGGLVFIPHIFEYKENSKKILNYILNNYKVDGLECFYTTFSSEQHNELLEICKKYRLFISGGSDFHGTRKPDIKLGIGRGDLCISKEILSWM